MCPRTDENAVRRLEITDAHHLEVSALHRFSNVGYFHFRIGANAVQETRQIRQAVGLEPGDVQSRLSHFQREANARARRVVDRDDPPRAAVFRNGHGLEFLGDRGTHAIPDVIQSADLEVQLRSGLGVNEKMNVPGGAIGRRALVIVEQMEEDRAIDGLLVPHR